MFISILISLASVFIIGLATYVRITEGYSGGVLTFASIFAVFLLVATVSSLISTLKHNNRGLRKRDSKYL